MAYKLAHSVKVGIVSDKLAVIRANHRVNRTDSLSFGRYLVKILHYCDLVRNRHVQAVEAARGKEGHAFPWEAKEVKSDKGCFYANFKPDRGNYTKDGSLITSRCGIFSANSSGLYDMAGNVAEWTSTVYTEAGVEAMSDMNPELKYNAALEDPYRLKKKSVRGGSWKDPESMIRSAWRSYEYQNQPRSYVGFRCVRTMISDTRGTSSRGRKK